MTDQQFEQSFSSLHLGGDQQFTTPQRPSAASGSLRSPNGDLPSQPHFAQGFPTSNPQSAAARFERFFPSSPGQPSGMPYANNSMGSAAGLAANGAFGSFGHSLAPGTIGSSGGSGHFGSSAANRKAPRAAIPSQWNADPSLSPSSGGSPPAGYYGHQPNFMGHQQNSSGSDDDVIPTAIVVKNIPFSVKKEQLLQIIEDLAIPMPYAFNYHFDQGVFRGLAFANFKTSEEADAVVAALNGFDVSGRKLRVEYKKVLQAGEKERIEKEKAIKRMQSMQLEKERRRQDEYTSHNYLMPGYAAEQQPFADATPLTADTLKAIPNSSNGQPVAATSEISGGAPSSSKKDELDLNDAATLEIYSRVLLFKDDRMRDELSFSRSLSPLERRTVHLVAQKLGLYHYSMGEGDERYVIVTKNEVPAQTRPLRSQASTIGRSNGHLSARGMLRMKKSAPDMKRMENYNSSLMVPATVASRRSNTNLREGYSATMGRRPQPGGVGGAAGLQSLFSSPFDVPPVPSLGSDLPSPSALRQPRGPPSSDTGNFAHRKLNVTTHEPLEI